MYRCKGFSLVLIGFVLMQGLLCAGASTIATYSLSVVSGSGSGSYAAGSVVTITAKAPPASQVFADWSGATVQTTTKATTTLTMPAANTAVTANYTAASTIAPASPSVTVGQTVQFTAQLAGVTSGAVTWKVAGIAGGSSTYGTISANGLYTAPTTPPEQVPLVAASSGTASASTYVLVLLAGPTVTSVSPTSLPIGTSTISIQGLGFQTGAEVLATSVNGPVGLSAKSLTPTTITAVYYQPPAASATFSVKNPSSAYGNSITVPVANGSKAYSLTVMGGAGGGSYPAGTVVTIAANAPPAGQVFTDWTGATVQNASASATTLTMPAANTTVTANYVAVYTLTVVSGSGGGSYRAGTEVTIAANPPPAGQVFTGWTGATVQNATNATTTLTMPAANTTLTATYVAVYTLTVVSGSGGGGYPAGTVVTITANPPPAGQVFSNWTGPTVQNATSSTTTLTMPAANTTLNANYAAAPYSLTVIGGIGSGSYAAGTVVTITANAPPAGEVFADWTGATLPNASASTTTLTIPAANTTVTANYVAGYKLTLVNGSGSGSYAAGTVVTITANAAPAGKVFANWAGAAVQSATASTTTLTMPAGSTTVTANYVAGYTLTVVSGSGGGSYTAGTVVTITANASAGGTSFSGWTGTTVASPSSVTTTLTMPAANTAVIANYAPTTIPFPVTTHPRLWITQSDLPRLQSWATPSNPVYAQGLLPVLAQAVSDYTIQYFPNGSPNPNYPDAGDINGYDNYVTEQDGVVLAFNSLIDPSPANRILYATYTHNLLMYAMNQAALGHLASAPFRDPFFALDNRANTYGECWGLMVDWLYNATDGSGNSILTATDKATIQKVFLIWSNDCLNAEITGPFDHPAPIGVTNSLQLLPGNLPNREVSNNYYLAHARLLTMMALCLDPSDDPPVNSGAPASELGNTLRSYIPNATGAWLYTEFAMMGDPSVVATAYGIPGNGAGLGLASGGLPPEGILYGHDYGFLLGQLLALQTAGFNSASLSGPQIQLIGAPVWDRWVTGMLSSLTPTAKVFPQESYLGPVYQLHSYGDLLRQWMTPDMMRPFALLALLDQENGQTSHLNAARWFSVNAVPGGAANLIPNITGAWGWGVESAILYYLLLDPAAPAATDPRPTYPTTFYDPTAGRVLARTDWTANATVFDYRAGWHSIDHQQADGGQFEFYRKGEWLTKEMSNYDANWWGEASLYHNTLTLQNWCPNATPNLEWFEANLWPSGSQWLEGLDAGDPTTVSSSGTGYTYAASNLTNLYNERRIPATNITQATRSIVWLNNDYIVVYDRATSLNAGLFKQFNLCLVTDPTIKGNLATETLASGQQLFVQTLLPANAAISSINGASNLNGIADLEPTQYIMSVQDPTLPADTRFLHVLQGADAGASPVAATYLQSLSGTSFDGAVFGSAAVYFPVSANGQFTATTFSAPAGVQTLLVTGLSPLGSYSVNIQAGANGNVVTITPGGTGATTDAAGVLQVTP